MKKITVLLVFFMIMGVSFAQKQGIDSSFTLTGQAKVRLVNVSSNDFTTYSLVSLSPLAWGNEIKLAAGDSVGEERTVDFPVCEKDGKQYICFFISVCEPANNKSCKDLFFTEPYDESVTVNTIEVSDWMLKIMKKKKLLNVANITFDNKAGEGITIISMDGKSFYAGSIAKDAKSQQFTLATGAHTFRYKVFTSAENKKQATKVKVFNLTISSSMTTVDIGSADDQEEASDSEIMTVTLKSQYPTQIDGARTKGDKEEPIMIYPGETMKIRFVKNSVVTLTTFDKNGETLVSKGMSIAVKSRKSMVINYIPTKADYELIYTTCLSCDKSKQRRR